MTWILLILSVSSVLIGNSFFIFAKRKREKKRKEKEKEKRAKRFEIKSPMQ
jgi:cytochrome c-type biogenesis protein CcmH/NrfF